MEYNLSTPEGIQALLDYFKKERSEGKHEFRISFLHSPMTGKNGEKLNEYFYIHPLGGNGDTRNFLVD
jgi:hypothetical protein